VSNKADLLDGMVEQVLTEFPSPPAALPWPKRLSCLARAIRESARRHPQVFPLLLQRPVATAAAREVRDGVLTALREAGVPADRVHRTERLVSTAVLGFAVSEAAGRSQRHSRHTLDSDFDRLQELLKMFVDAEVAATTWR